MSVQHRHLKHDNDFIFFLFRIVGHIFYKYNLKSLVFSIFFSVQNGIKSFEFDFKIKRKYETFETDYFHKQRSRDVITGTSTFRF